MLNILNGVKLAQDDSTGDVYAVDCADGPKKLTGGGGGSVPKPLTYDYMPEGYPTKAVGTATVMEEQVVEFASSGDGLPSVGSLTTTFTPVEGQTYIVNWDGTEHECVCSIFNGSYLVLGNLSIMGAGDDTGEPFVYINLPSRGSEFETLDTASSHTIKVTTISTVYQTIDEKFLPLPPRQVRNLDITKSYSTKEVEEIHQSVKDGAAIYLTKGHVITGISYIPNDNFSYILPDGQQEIIRPVGGVWDFTNRETVYPSSIPFDSRYGNYAYIQSDPSCLGGVNQQGYELIGTNMAGFIGDYIQVDSSIVLKLRDANYYLYISATANGEIKIVKRRSGLSSGGETTTLFKNGDDSMILKSSTEGSTKKFKITVDDSGTISATEVT